MIPFNAAIAAERLRCQGLLRPLAPTPADIVSRFGAVQAQEFGPATWGLALRMGKRADRAAIRRAFDEGRILRTHVLRPTWHFVTPADIVWMLDLTAPRVRQAMAFGSRNLGLTETMYRKAVRVIERELQTHGPRTRAELGARLSRERLPGSGIHLAFLAMGAELDGLICSGPRRGAQMTYALLAERAPRARPLERDEALGELAARYFSSHGPATVRDFGWWSGLTMRDAMRGIEIARARKREVEGLSYWTIGGWRAAQPARHRLDLLPIYDEYIVAYRDLAAVPRGPTVLGRLPQAIIAGGEVVGSWKAVRQRSRTTVQVVIPGKLTAAQVVSLARAVERCEAFFA